ncbi:hypothetical protein PCANC_11405 [Puccinia coronata f. sp. avenae]|uniref:Uncharacterized protein n=1 Tax=Puccinia coronata f. sp. avenae TaxID=200324 RepID=A0A2N5SNL8_9BASI|nr:hypothetical protein PCANC_18177 [Puccinia coronata f. sp. avenae]PLW51193.1 hypothetical protein PCANC_11405 [Puccinia coronata f. sp. avenae]
MSQIKCPREINKQAKICQDASEFYTTSFTPKIGSAENHFAIGNLHSSQGGIEDVVNSAALMSRKRTPEKQSDYHQPVSPGLSTHWTDYDFSAGGDFLEANPGNGIMSDVAKRQRTVPIQDGYGADHIPEFGRDSDVFSFTGPTHRPMFPLINYQDHEFEQFASFPSVSASHHSLRPYPSHDAPYHASLDIAREHSKLPTQQAMFQSMSLHKTQTQLLAEFQSSGLLNFDGSSWRLFSHHNNQPQPSFPVPESIPGHGLQEFSPLLKDPYARQDDAQRLAQNQIRSDRPFEDHIHNPDPMDVPLSPGLMTSGRSTADSLGALSDHLYENHRTSSQESGSEAQVNVKQGARIFNKSPQADSGRYKRLHENPLLNSKLQNLVFPHTAIREKGLAAFTNEFTHEIKKNFDKKPRTTFDMPQHPLAKQFPVEVYEQPSGKCLIRPKINYALSSRGASKEDLLSRRFIQLIKWLLLINTTIYRKLNPAEATSHAELNSNIRLKHWFFKELFAPEKGLPVLGTVERQDLDALATEEAFGPIQHKLFSFLPLPRPVKEATPYALSIIILYYEHTNPKILDELGSTPDNFFPLIKAAIDSRVKISCPPDDPNGNQLGDFEIYGLQRFPQQLRPGNSKLSTLYKPKVERGESEDIMIKEFKDIILGKDKSITQFKKLAVEPSSFPVSIILAKKEKQGRPFALIWLENVVNRRKLDKDYIFNKLDFLMDHLNACYSKLVKYMENNHVKVEEENMTQDEYFQWFRDIVLGAGNQKIPLIGRFALDDKRQTDPSFSQSDFHEAQIFLITFITDGNCYSKYFQVALTLIGYWLKHERNSVYEKLFKNDEHYWNTLLSLVE